MPIESATYVTSLVAANPTATDDRSQGDDHVRLIKSCLLATFPNLTGAMTATHTVLNGLNARVTIVEGDATDYLRADGVKNWASDQNANTHKIINLSAPSSNNDSARLVDVRAMWPVGAVFLGAFSTNPNTLLGFGTWSTWTTNIPDVYAFRRTA